MKNLWALASNRYVRGAFLVGALGLALWAIARDRESLIEAFGEIGVLSSLAAFALSAMYVFLTMLSWRVLLAALGSQLGVRDAGALFFSSQLGKYIPGSVWNFVAAAELGKDRGISRARSAVALLLATVMGLIAAMPLAGTTAWFVPFPDASWVRWGVLLVPIGFAMLVPRVLNALVGVAAKMTKSDAVPVLLSPRSILSSYLWATLALLAAGLQVWLIVSALGVPREFQAFLLATGGFAAAWFFGFVFVIAPAGVGAREAVMFPVFATLLAQPQILALALLSRVLFTLADLALAFVPALLARARFRRG